MKKKVISLFVTGMLAVSMIAGCGSDNTADTSTSADTTADASTDATKEIPQQRKHKLQQTLMQVNMSTYYPARMDPVQEVHSSNYSNRRKDADGNKVDKHNRGSNHYKQYIRNAYICSK